MQFKYNNEKEILRPLSLHCLLFLVFSDLYLFCRILKILQPTFSVFRQHIRQQHTCLE